MSTAPVRFAPARRLRGLVVLAALTFATVARASGTSPAPKGRDVNVYGRKVRMTTPIGMGELPVTQDMKGVPYARFAPESQLQRPTTRSFESMPYTAKANAEADVNRSDSTAEQAIALLRAEPTHASNSPEAEDLKHALKSGLAGGRDVLMTRAPEGITLIERIEDSPQGVVDLTAIGQRGDFTLVGSAFILVRGRAVWLRIIRLAPENESDLVGVHEAIIHWVRDMREANRPHK